MPRRLTTRPERRPPTFDLAKEACEALFRETGVTPSTDAVVERIGINNRPLIRRAIEDWLLDLPARLYRREDLPGIPPVMIEQFRALWEAAVRTAGTAFDRERATHQIELANQATTIAALEATTATAQAERERAEQARIEADITNATLRQELADAGQRQAELVATLAAARAENERLQADRDSERRQAAERVAFLEARIEKDSAWYLQRINEEREEAQRTAQRDINRRDQDISQMRLELSRAETGARALREELAALRERADGLEKTLAATAAERDAKASALATATESLAGLHAAERAREELINSLKRELALHAAEPPIPPKPRKRGKKTPAE